MSEDKKNDPNTIETLVCHRESSEDKTQRKIVEDVLRTIKDDLKHNRPLKFSISKIEQAYKLKDVPEMKLEDSIWYNLTKDEQIGFSIQGFRETTKKDGSKIRVPHIGFSADLDYLDKMIGRFITKINNLKNNADK